MKKIFLLAMVMISSFLSAQTVGTATVNVVLSDVMQIKVRPSQSIVSVPIQTAAHYQNGNSVNSNNHLEMTSTSGYQVTAQLSGDFSNGTETIPANKLQLTLTTSTSDSGTTFSATDLPMSSSTAQQVLLTDGGDLERKMDVKYRITGGSELLNKPAGTYTAIVTYTITAP